MKTNLWIILAGVLTMLLLLAGCPREENAQGGSEDTTINVEVDSDTADTSDVDSSAEDASSESMTAEGEAADGTTPEGETAAGAEGTENTETGDTPVSNDGSAADAVEVVLETSKGNVVLHVHSAWAPLGAEQFLKLVRDGFYDGAPIFRNIDGFMAQFGIAADPAKDAQWRTATLKDDPVMQKNTRGMVTFAMAGPNTRSTQIFINKADNSFLDAQGFAPFAEVVEGLDIVDAWFVTGDGTVNQGTLMQNGIEYFRSVAPEGDVITKAYIRE